MAAVTAALAAPAGLESVQAALPMVLERFSGMVRSACFPLWHCECMVCMIFAGKLGVPSATMCQSTGHGYPRFASADDSAVVVALANVLSTPDSASVDVEELVLETVGDERWQEVLQEASAVGCCPSSCCCCCGGGGSQLTPNCDKLSRASTLSSSLFSSSAYL